LIILLPRHAGLQESNFAAAKEFRPERWLSGNPSGAHKRRAFFPFGTGLRICPGRSLALLESKMAIAMICQNFHVSPATPIDEVEEHYEATMQPRNLAVYFDVREKGKGAVAN
jgi:cytochrome P450